MNKKLSQLLDSTNKPAIICMCLFVVLAIPFQPVLALLEAVLTLILYAVLQYVGKKRRNSIRQYVEGLTGGLDSASKNAVLNASLPILVFRADTLEVVWSNDSFLKLAGQDDGLFFNIRLDELVPSFSTQWIMNGEGECPDRVLVGDRIYRVFGSTNRVGGKKMGENLLTTTYWVDVTETTMICDRYEATRPIVSIVQIDNYEELMKAGGEAAKSSVLARIDEKLNAWVADKNGLLRKYDRDRYLFVFEEQYFERIVEEKFSILDSVHEVVSEDGVAATLSIGMGKDDESFESLFASARKCIEMALSRGGDQAVVRDNLDFQFYGGRRQSTAKRTKVKSRVMAKALGDLIADSSEVYVMGHKYADMDCVGAAAGVCCMARKHGKQCRIVLDLDNNNAAPLVRRLQQNEAYAECFISGSDAFVHAKPGALLVVVDTNRPDMVESEQLLDSCNRVAVIDHHRRAATYIESAALNFHEPYASSAGELVAELLQYMVEQTDLLRCEAEALLSGIVLDTKNFTMRTGGRTFEAAAFLRRSGADTAEVSRMFQSDLHSMISRYDIIRRAKMIHEDIAVAVVDTECPRIVAAKAADDLLTVKGVQASFVAYRSSDGVGLSARSLGDVNVQVVLEALGGGGNSTTAGGFVPNTTVDVVRDQLLQSINRYFEE